MVANPNDIPAAFRGRQRATPSYIGMDDETVLMIAANALRMVHALPFNSKPRADQWASFEAAMAELGSRAVTQTLAKIWEIHEQEAGVPEIEP